MTSGVYPITVGCMIDTATQLLRDIEAFLETSGMTATALGLAAVNDGHLVRDLREGVDIRASKIDRVRKFMADYRPPRPRAKGNGHAVAA